MQKKVALIGSGSLMPSQCNSIKGYTVPCGTSNSIKQLSKKELKKILQQKERRNGN